MKIGSVSGGFKTPLPTTRSQKLNRSRLVDIQGGGVKVRFKSVSGSLRLVHSDDSEPADTTTVAGTNLLKESVPSSSSSGRPSRLDSMEVLNRIAGGELPVEEALKELT